jgi:hypothetical protein
MANPSPPAPDFTRYTDAQLTSMVDMPALPAATRHQIRTEINRRSEAGLDDGSHARVDALLHNHGFRREQER